MEKKGTLKTPQTPQTPQTPETPKTPETPGTPKTPDTYHHSIFGGKEWTHIKPLMVLRAAAVTALNREYNQSSEWGGILIFSQSKSSVRKI